MSMPMVRLADLAELNPRLAERPSGDCPVSFLGMADLDADSGTTTQGVSRPFEEVAKGYTQFANGDLLVAKITPCFENGKICQAGLLHEHGSGSTEFHVVRPDRSRIDDRFLLFYLRQPWIRLAGERRMTGSAGQRRVPESFLADLPVPLPSLAEQRRIAQVLDQVDALRGKRRAAIALVDDLMQSVFLEAFGSVTGALDRWPTSTLSVATAQIIDCPHSTPKWTESGEICLRTSNLQYGRWDWTDTRYVSEETYAERSKRGMITPGDIILSREGTVGVAAIVEKGMRLCMGQRLVQIKPDTGIAMPQYLLRYLLQVLAPERISRFMNGSTSRHLNVRDLKSLVIPIPPLHLQKEYDARCAALSVLRNAHVSQLVELDALFSSAQSRAFRGALWAEASAS